MEENKVMILDFRFSLNQHWTLVNMIWDTFLVLLQISETFIWEILCLNIQGIIIISGSLWGKCKIPWRESEGQYSDNNTAMKSH